MDYTLSTVGGDQAGTRNLSSIYVRLTPIETRKRDQFVIMEAIRKEVLTPRQRLVVGLFSLLGALSPGRSAVWIVGGWLIALTTGGAYVAARQSWLQWHPPEIASCGRDFYGIVDNFPLHQALPMIFRGSGDCTKVDWTFLGGSIANWSFVLFTGLALLALFTLIGVLKHKE